MTRPEVAVTMPDATSSLPSVETPVMLTLLNVDEPSVLMPGTVYPVRFVPSPKKVAAVMLLAMEILDGSRALLIVPVKLAPSIVPSNTPAESVLVDGV